jgi:hypothetical protein
MRRMDSAALDRFWVSTSPANGTACSAPWRTPPSPDDHVRNGRRAHELESDKMNGRSRRIKCQINRIPTNPPFERSSKRRKGFPSETHVKTGFRVVHGDKDLLEKLGRNDPCPCGSGRRFQEVLFEKRNL